MRSRVSQRNLRSRIEFSEEKKKVEDGSGDCRGGERGEPDATDIVEPRLLRGQVGEQIGQVLWGGVGLCECQTPVFLQIPWCLVRETSIVKIHILVSLQAVSCTYLECRIIFLLIVVSYSKFCMFCNHIADETPSFPFFWMNILLSWHINHSTINILVAYMFWLASW